jgi:hypothetical protein
MPCAGVHAMRLSALHRLHRSDRGWSGCRAIPNRPTTPGIVERAAELAVIFRNSNPNPAQWVGGRPERQAVRGVGSAGLLGP